MKAALIALSVVGLLASNAAGHTVGGSPADESGKIVGCHALIVPRLISRPPPQYSRDVGAAAWAWGKETYVDLEVVVGKDGVVNRVSVVGVQPVNSAVSRQFQTQSIDFVKRWLFEPAAQRAHEI